jgi:hypothetical protein
LSIVRQDADNAHFLQNGVLLHFQEATVRSSRYFLNTYNDPTHLAIFLESGQSCFSISRRFWRSLFLRGLVANHTLQSTDTALRRFAVHSLVALGTIERGRSVAWSML